MATDPLSDYYDRTSDRFWDASGGPVGRDLVVYPLLAGLHGSVLEYGCGAGSLLLHLARQQRFSQAVGVDISKRAISSLTALIGNKVPHLQDKIELCQPESDLLPQIPDSTMDVIISVATIEHVLNPYTVLDELHRIAKPTATLICSVPNYAYMKHRLALLLGELPRTGTDEPVQNWRRAGWDGMHLHAFTKPAFSVLLTNCGWTPEAWTGWGERFGWLRIMRRRYPSLFSGEIIALCKKTQEPV
jgi:SAM-dependent methyltransferase